MKLACNLYVAQNKRLKRTRHERVLFAVSWASRPSEGVMLLQTSMKIFVLMMILFVVCMTTKAQRFDFKSRVGVVDVNEDGKLCLIIANSDLANGGSISLIVLSNRQSVAKTTIKEKLEQSCSHNPDTGDASFYLLESPRQAFKIKERQAAAIAVIASPSIKVQNGRAMVDLDKDGYREFFRACTSNEGVHLTVWSGKPLQGKRRWHYYYYLGYDVVPSCKRRDYM